MRSSRFYSSWISLIIFLGFIIFIPYKVSLFTFKISDVWLALCLGFQYRHGLNSNINFRHRKFIKNFGIWMGIVAVIATIFQAGQDGMSIDPLFFSHFYRFFRFFLIFKFAENVILNSRPKDLPKFLNAYTVIGTIIIILSLLEFYSGGLVQKIIVNLYFVTPGQTFAENFKDTGRLTGVMGNANATGIFMASTIVYPAFNLALRNTNSIKKILFLIYLLAAIFVIVVMTGSRASIITSGVTFVLFFFFSFSKVKNVIRFTFILISAVLVGSYIYTQFSSEFVIPDRVVYISEGKDSRGESASLFEALGRNELWLDRVKTYQNHAHPFAALIGMGYTKLYKDYSDNGLLSSFFNLGLAGSLMRLFLYYLVIRYCVIRSFKNFRRSNNNYQPIIFGMISFVFILWEFTAETIEHIKIGQLFYLFFCATFIYNAYYFRKKKIHTFQKFQNNPDEEKANYSVGLKYDIK